MDNLRRMVLSPSVAKPTKRFTSGAAHDFTPIKWSKYFDSQRDVVVRNSTFHLYSAGKTGPVLLMIHGGGYSALTWALFTEEILNKVDCQVLAVDLRGHGNTKTDDEENLALEFLVEDIVDIYYAVFEESTPPIVLVGHSLGGAIAVEVAPHIPNVVGVCVIDIVEGTALESLSSMQSILRDRPSSFRSVEHAVQWSFRGGQTRNLEAARVSMPGQIINSQTGLLAASECDKSFTKGESSLEDRQHFPRLAHHRHVDSIVEEHEDEVEHSKQNKDCDLGNLVDISIGATPAAFKEPGKPPPHSTPSSMQFLFKQPSTDSQMYRWRIDLSKTEPFWTGWFKGLSQKFLDLQAPKVLLLANIHGMDKTLMMGQMQGRFQLQVLPLSGHAIHEDQPHHVADIIAGFLVRQKIAVACSGFTPGMPGC